MKEIQIAVIGGGPAGLAAAIAAWERGVRDIIIFERGDHLGGILNQCIHSGFGLHTFKEELTGPEYAHRYIAKARELGIPVLLNTMVLDITSDKVITAVNEDGLIEIKAQAIILAMGCRERPRGALNTPGDRPVGVYTAGTAQKFVNLDGYMPGNEVVILGSGDIGLIMARRMTLEGAKVHAVVELLPYSGGLKRNIVQCLDDYDIPLYLSHTVTRIIGRKRLQGVVIAEVDENRNPKPETEHFIACDTLLLSVGLLPENELSKCAGVKLSGITGGAVVDESLQTNVEGVFACGNVLHVHDLVDYVSEESEIAGHNAADYVLGKSHAGGGIPVETKGGVRYTVPFTINPENIGDKLDLRFRVGNVYKGYSVRIYFDDEVEYRRKSRILTPGEMETVTLKRELFEKHPNLSRVTVAVEEM